MSPDSSRPNPTPALSATEVEKEGGLRDGGRSNLAYELVISASDGVNAVVLKLGSSYVIGRDDDCDIKLTDSSVSRHHARLKVDDIVSLEDLGSTNGSTVAGRAAPPGAAFVVSPGTVFELGSATFLLQRGKGSVTKRLNATSRASPGEFGGGKKGPVVADPAMRRIYALLDVIGPAPLNVLVLGETGVGKEVLAAELRARSTRADRPFLQLNCPALPEGTLEGELFGYEKGAFTGAVQAKAGLFESAEGGTVFLDEIGDMPLSTQAKLLRVLESGDVLRLGSVKGRKVDVRFVAATNIDLKRAIAEGKFRADLFYRLNGITITLPPLRRREADILPLAQHFVRSVSERLNRSPPALSTAVEELLQRHPWPGNVRELKNVIDRAVVMTTGAEVQPEHIHIDQQPGDDSAAGDAPPANFAASGMREALSTTLESALPLPGRMVFSETPVSSRNLMAAAARPLQDADADDGAAHRSLRGDLKAIERERIIEALSKCAGNQSQAARELGMSRYTLISRIEEYGLARPRKR